jgi:hypothetical protein
LLLMGSTLVNYMIGREIELRRARQADRRIFLIGGLIFNLGLIALFKYQTLFVSTANDLLNIGLPVPNFFLPLAISFFTFEQISYLVDADAGKTAEKMQELVAAWAAGDVERILKDFDDANLSPELEKRLFRDRNAAWADWVQTTLKRPGRHFMAVGAAHMAGPHSLIALLKARGFKVKRVQ